MSYLNRPYFGLCLGGPRLKSIAGLRSRLGDLAGDIVDEPQVNRGWKAHRLEIMHPDYLYPDSDDRERKRGDEYAHDLYVLARSSAFGGNSQLVVLSPYVRLLHKVIDQIESTGVPLPHYSAVGMEDLYGSLEEESLVEEGREPLPTRFRASRITLQMDADDDLGIVSLSGASPLLSQLYKSLRAEASAYGIRVEVVSPEGAGRVHLDRFGNIRIHVAVETRLAAVCALVDRIDEDDIFDDVRIVPYVARASVPDRQEVTDGA